MSTPIKAIVYGLGVVGIKQIKPLVSKGVEIVGAIEINPELVGRDLGEAAGLEPLGVIISDDADQVLADNPADIALLSLFTEVDRMAPFIEKCVRHGLNVVTPADDLNYPWNQAPELSAQLDELAKQHGVSVAGTGMSDGFMINAIASYSGACEQIDSIYMETEAPLNHVGQMDLEVRHIGGDFEQATKVFKEFGDMSGKRSGLEALAAALGLTTTSARSEATPIAADEDIPCPKQDMTIQKGQVQGVRSEMILETEEGVTLTGAVVFIMRKPDHPSTGYDMKLTIKGEPTLHTRFDDIVPTIPVSNQLVNRIPDVINAEPGLITVDQLPRPQYRSKPMHFYVNDQ